MVSYQKGCKKHEVLTGHAQTFFASLAFHSQGYVIIIIIISIIPIVIITITISKRLQMTSNFAKKKKNGTGTITEYFTDFLSTFLLGIFVLYVKRKKLQTSLQT